MLFLKAPDFPLFQYSMEQAPKAIPNMEKEQMIDIRYYELKRYCKGKSTGVGKKSIEQEWWECKQDGTDFGDLPEDGKEGTGWELV